MAKRFCSPVCVSIAILFPRGFTPTTFVNQILEGEFATIEPRVIVNHAGTILSKEVIEMGPDGFVEIVEYGFEDSMTLQEWLDSKPE